MRGDVRTFIMLLRGVNVGGKRLLPMKELVAILDSLGCQNVRTYIQSGNAVFQRGVSDTSRLAIDITAAIAKHRGFAPRVLVFTSQQLANAVHANPFPDAKADPKSLHLFFLDGKPTETKLKLVEELRTKTEFCALNGRVLYLHAPDGIGRSKLAANIERKLAVAATGRNWRTVCKLLEIVSEIE